MKIFILFLFTVINVHAIPVYEFFKKGSTSYYQINSANIIEFFKRELKWPSNAQADLFESCRKNYTHFGLKLSDEIMVTLFQIKFGQGKSSQNKSSQNKSSQDKSNEQSLEYYCLLNDSIVKQVEKLKGKKIKLQKGRYYHFRWDILNSGLSVYSVQKTKPPPGRQKPLPAGFTLFPLHLLDLQTGKIIYFMHVEDRAKAAVIHPLIDIKYPVLFNEQNGEYEFALIEANPQFFELKTRVLFKAFNHVFGIIPDRIGWRDGPIAVMP
ncbi:MAG: hypothetical protein B7Y39_14120 [Bdellovibrio sp. 28-41-41]|nr:MAG: hypothetical protein B7Y39_14120 [Bdellovibrio sp. 28-41-41]